MLFDKHSVRQPKKSDEAILYIGGKKTTQGTIDDMVVLFQQEAQRTKATIEVRTKQPDGSYKVKLRQSRGGSAQ